MSEQRIVHGGLLDVATPDEIARIVGHALDDQRAIDYYRARGALQLNAQGVVQQQVEEVPAGYDWFCERIGVTGPVGAVLALYENDPSGPNLLEALTIPGNGMPSMAATPADQRTVTVANPAAGAEWSAVVPAGTFWRVTSGQASFQTSAAVGTRVAAIQLSTPTGVIGTSPPATGQAASIGPNLYTFGPGYVPSTRVGQGPQGIPIPDVWLPPGSTIGSNTTLRDVGDQWSGIELQVEEWIQTTTGVYSDAFSNNLYVPANSSIIAVVTGGTANGQVAYNIQIRRVRRPQ